MNTRSNKHRILRSLHVRFHGSVQWRSAEERAWLDIAPLRREFGSRDYHRFEQLEGFAFDVFEDMAQAQQWLSQSHPALGERTPNDCASNDCDLQTALDLIAQLTRGVGSRATVAMPSLERGGT